MEKKYKIVANLYCLDAEQAFAMRKRLVDFISGMGCNDLVVVVDFDDEENEENEENVNG